MTPDELRVGLPVEKTGGDYRFRGVVVAVFRKRSGHAVRCVVENDDGVLHIFSPSQLEDAGRENCPECDGIGETRGIQCARCCGTGRA